MSWRSQDYVPEPIVAVLIADMGTLQGCPTRWSTGCKGSHILYILPRVFPWDQEEDPSNVRYNSMCCVHSG